MRSETQALRVAVWGLGGHAERRLLPALARCEATTLAGVTTRDAGRGVRLAEAHGCVFWPRPEEMLADGAVDAVLVATPIGCHPEHGLAVLQAGKHLWCEKSLAPSAPEAEALVAEARRRRLLLAECFMYLYHPHFLAVEAAAARIGEIVSLSSHFFLPHLDKPGFRHTRALGGSALLDAGCYPVRAAIALLGDDLEVRHARLVQPPGFEVDMIGHATLAGPSGVTAQIAWGFGAAYRNEITVFGTEGSIDADRIFSKTTDYVSALVIRDLRGSARSEPVAAADSFVAMFAALAGAHRDEAARDALYARATAQARLLDRIREAAA
jgi:predicted dehydrogenase